MNACPEPDGWRSVAPSPFAELVDAVATLPEDELMWDLLQATVPPPVDRLARKRLRHELVSALRWRGMQAPTAIADAWLSPRRRRRAA